eukprot:TRINITY_DN50379_c0_g1_i1.p1 TRINITY_DN50379_c0_g1~~TRINITY_DN50379_c0_g1_i1.p1  ORF type:complete len:257 (-),score=35.23 TRINITY_DN50379_c0_g1_i1:122-892(-)
MMRRPRRSTLSSSSAASDVYKRQLIAPCECRGSQQFVHRSCLDTWRSTKHNSDAFSRCSVCGFKFKMKLREAERRKLGELIAFQLKVVGDLAVGLLVVYSLILVVSMLLLHVPAGSFLETNFSVLLPGDRAGYPRWFDSLGQNWALFPGNYLPWTVGLSAFALGAGLVLTYPFGIFERLGLVLPEWPESFPKVFIGGGSLVFVVSSVLVLLGVLIGVGTLSALLKRSVVRHRKASWLYDETSRHVVVDLYGKEIVS